ncbi:uracil-DNA glycosylase [Nibricoccus aquaticus]|uniref:Type-4 uracil-DNA glycosylase n=1 Tax=Nibricoccus aquaticus TaxID=2576891 RepID=A0A290QAM8_9BACT|nr:uracil-DNA glycosylase [Nibricoccus aquaticus]ATC65719.1 uracil-DNA glycosylase [Nibricoccus aquaticus]
MRAALTALSDELKRLRAGGVKTVSVSDQALAGLRKIVAARAGQSGGNVATTSTASGTAMTDARKGVLAPGGAAPSPVEGRAGISVSAAAAATSGLASQPAATTAGATKLPPPPVVSLPPGDKQTRWDALLAMIRSDSVCVQHLRPGKKVVLGVGSLDAKIFFCGEAPGAEEEIQGEPFVGPAGQLLTKMIQGMGLKRSDVYIGNIMNWRPDLPTVPGQAQMGNRPPTEEEITYCLPYLRAQLEIVNPDLIVALGSTAAQGLFGYGSFKTLGEIRGNWKPFAEKPVMVTYHPSYILRNPTNRSKRAIWEDLLKVMQRAALPISDKQKSFFLDK